MQFINTLYFILILALSYFDLLSYSPRLIFANAETISPDETSLLHCESESLTHQVGVSGVLHVAPDSIVPCTIYCRYNNQPWPIIDMYKDFSYQLEIFPGHDDAPSQIIDAVVNGRIFNMSSSTDHTQIDFLFSSPHPNVFERLDIKLFNTSSTILGGRLSILTIHNSQNPTAANNNLVQDDDDSFLSFSNQTFIIMLSCISFVSAAILIACVATRYIRKRDSQRQEQRDREKANRYSYHSTPKLRGLPPGSLTNYHSYRQQPTTPIASNSSLSQYHSSHTLDFDVDTRLLHQQQQQQQQHMMSYNYPMYFTQEPIQADSKEAYLPLP